MCCQKIALFLYPGYALNSQHLFPLIITLILSSLFLALLKCTSITFAPFSVYILVIVSLGIMRSDEVF